MKEQIQLAGLQTSLLRFVILVSITKGMVPIWEGHLVQHVRVRHDSVREIARSLTIPSALRVGRYCAFNVETLNTNKVLRISFSVNSTRQMPTLSYNEPLRSAGSCYRPKLVKEKDRVFISFLRGRCMTRRVPSVVFRTA